MQLIEWLGMVNLQKITCYLVFDRADVVWLINVVSDKSLSLCEIFPEVLCDLLDELDGLAVLLSWHVHGVQYANGQILSHEAALDCFDH